MIVTKPFYSVSLLEGTTLELSDNRVFYSDTTHLTQNLRPHVIAVACRKAEDVCS